MINCQELGEIKISGTQADILIEYCFITSCLLESGVNKEDVLNMALAGLFKDEIKKSEKQINILNKIDEMVKEFLGKEGKA